MRDDASRRSRAPPELEELGQELHRTPRESTICGALRRLVHVEHVGADPVARAVVLSRITCSLARKHRPRRAPGRRLATPSRSAARCRSRPRRLAIPVLVVDDLALGVANALDDHLLGGLGEDPAEAAGVELPRRSRRRSRLRIVLAGRIQLIWVSVVDDLLDDLAELEELDLAGLLVEARFDLPLLPNLRRAAWRIASSSAPMITSRCDRCPCPWRSDRSRV